MNNLHHTHGARNPQIAGAARTSFAMQASFLSSSIEEEDFIDNIQPHLVESTSADSCCSHIGLDIHDDGTKDMDLDLDIDVNPSHDANKSRLKHNVTQTQNRAGMCDAETKPSTSRSSACDLNKSAQEYASSRTRPKTKLSLSMHDISVIPTYPLTPKSSHLSSSTIQSHSMTTDTSIPKSKDSGFPRSSSCFSLNSSKSYMHVQSKVKEYIKQIKAENEAHRRSSSSKGCLYTPVIPSPSEQDLQCGETISVKTLVPIIHQLKDELEDKDKMLSTLQENYNSLLLKYAESKNQVDHLRLSHTAGVVSSPFNFDTAGYKKPQASPSLLLLSKLHELQREPCDSRSKQPDKSQHKNRTNLSPITKSYSTSVRLDKLFEHPLVLDDSKEAAENSVSSSTKYNPLRIRRVHMNKDIESFLERSESNDTTEHKMCINKELSSERLNDKFSENPFIKVKRWQESLPSFELIEPGNNYDSLNSHASHDNELSQSQYFNQMSSDTISSKQCRSTTNITKDDSSTNTETSDLILSRSMSQPNNYSFRDLRASLNESCTSTCFSPAATQLHNASHNFEQNGVSRSNTNSVDLSNNVTVVQNASASAFSQNTSNSPSDFCQSPSTSNQLPLESRHKASGRADTSNFNRKKQLGQKARMILFEYLKTAHNSSKNSLSHVNKTSSRQKVTRSASTGDVLKVNRGIEKDGSTYDEDVSLSECLDAMNQSCSNLRGKSEAIIQVLSKQLKDNTGT